MTVLRRRPAKSGPHTPLVLLLHGRGADEADLIDLADVLPRHFAYASVRAPVAVEGGGYTWFENRGPARPIAASLRNSVRDFRAWLDGPDVGLATNSVILFGFSAGMMMAGALLLNDPNRFAGAVLLSGALALDAQPDIPLPERLKDVPVFYAHGSSDDMIPRDLVARTKTYLETTSGATVRSKRYPHAHTISNPEIADINTWLLDRS